jgi:hypothetical protein
MKEQTMNEKPSARLTFAILDRQKGFANLPPAKDEEYPLPAWYRAVCETPLDELGLEGICKACRQQIHLEHVVPLALRILKAEPLAGEMYDGELLVSLKSVPLDYWPAHHDHVLPLKPIVEVACQNMNSADDLYRDMRELLARVG